MAIATLYCATQLHSKTFPRQLFPGACVTRKTLPCHKSTLKSSLLPQVAVAASSSSVQAEPRTTAATPAKVLTFRVGQDFDLHDWSLGILSSLAVSIFLMIEDAKLTPMVMYRYIVFLLRYWGHRVFQISDRYFPTPILTGKG